LICNQGNKNYNTTNEQGHFRVVSKDGIELTGRLDIKHHQEKWGEVAIKEENGKSEDDSSKESTQEKSVAWNQIIFTPSENFSTHRKKEEYQFWFNQKGNLILFDEKNKIKELYERIKEESTEG